MDYTRGEGSVNLRPREKKRAAKIDAGLKSFHAGIRWLPGIARKNRQDALVEQFIESMRRIDFVRVISGRQISSLRADPTSDLFDPIRGAAWHRQEGNIDEACWLVFLSVHFGKNLKTGWRLAQAVYGGRDGGIWTWRRVSAAPKQFRRWLGDNHTALKASGKFGNHRKYESLDAQGPRGTGEAIESYVRWINPPGTHMQFFNAASAATGGNRRQMFDWLYKSMQKNVKRFSRLSCFDYLTMLGKLDLTPIEPGSVYMDGATGPFDGGKLLFGGNPAREQLDMWLVQLGDRLGVGMQVLEDAICNWQKSPDVFKRFRG
jgi:hypothetical protein